MKKTIQFTALLLVMTGAITFQACKKDKKDSTKTKTELITTGTWKITAQTVNPALDWDGDGDVETNLFDDTEACLKDNFITFKTNATAEENEGATKCDPLDDQIYNMSWNFTDNETKIEIDGDEYTLAELTASTLKISYTEVDAGVTYTFVITLGH
ncbi:MAG: lipocalin family protein [Chitinophagaceae bacterium]